MELQKAVEAAGYELVVENTEDTDSSGSFAAGRVSRLKRKTIGAIVLAIPVFVDWYVFYAYAPW